MTPAGVVRAGAVAETGGTLRLTPRAGEPGSLAGCPLCAPGYPPCLACRDELRSRLSQMSFGAVPGACWN